MGEFQDESKLTLAEFLGRKKLPIRILYRYVFTNKQNKRLNVVYHRKDGNISWIDPQV